MAEKTVFITQQQNKPIKILKWKVSEGNTVSIGRVVLLYDFDGGERKEQRRLKCTKAGTIRRLLTQEGAIVKPGYATFWINAGKMFLAGKCYNNFIVLGKTFSN